MGFNELVAMAIEGTADLGKSLGGRHARILTRANADYIFE